jgi:hypothetical protein
MLSRVQVSWRGFRSSRGRDILEVEGSFGKARQEFWLADDPWRSFFKYFSSMTADVILGMIEQWADEESWANGSSEDGLDEKGWR